MDVRHRARPRNDPVSADALSSKAVIQLMKCAFLLGLIVALGTSCASRTTSQANKSASPNSQPTIESAKPVTSDSDKSPLSEKEVEVPTEFKGVDFKNFTYPSSFERSSIRLKDGKYENPRPEFGGGDNFELSGVDFVDLTGDGKKEAVVQIFWVSCGASCDGGSNLLYVYSIRRNKLTLFWRIETGSTGYGGGLKSLIIKGRAITLELFNNCRFKGAMPVVTPTDGEFGKFSAMVFTRFQFEAGNKKVALKRREVFPYPSGNTLNYDGEISIGDA